MKALYNRSVNWFINKEINTFKQLCISVFLCKQLCNQCYTKHVRIFFQSSVIILFFLNHQIWRHPWKPWQHQIQCLVIIYLLVNMLNWNFFLTNRLFFSVARKKHFDYWFFKNIYLVVLIIINASCPISITCTMGK